MAVTLSCGPGNALPEDDRSVQNARRRVKTADLTVSVPQTVRPGTTIGTSIDVRGGHKNYGVDQWEMHVWAKNETNEPSSKRPTGRQSARQNVERQTLKSNCGNNGAEQLSTACSLELSPYLPLSLRNTSIEVSIATGPDPRDVHARIPIHVKPAARMRRFLTAVSALGFSIYDTSFDASTKTCEDGSGLRGPLQWIVFTPESGQFVGSDCYLLIAFDPTLDRLEVPLRLLSSVEWDANLEFRDQRNDRLRITNTDPQAVRRDLQRLLAAKVH